jgi:ubiquinone biosynthesis monooxygenase Coq7
MRSSAVITLLIAFDRAIKTLLPQAHPSPKRVYPADGVPETLFDGTQEQLQQSCYQMRINHTGEVCAQALYDGHYYINLKKEHQDWIKQAGDEEIEHLLWCHYRLIEIGGSPSKLNVLFYLGSYTMARVLSYCDPSWNMRFIRETEKQVAQHLSYQLDRLSFDSRSKAIIEQMRVDEQHHEQAAGSFEDKELPEVAKRLMSLLARGMKIAVKYF